MISSEKHDGAKAGHRFLEHTSEVRLEVWAGSMGQLLTEAGEALASLLLRQVAADGSVETHRLEIRSTDREALVVDWLNELLYRSEAEGWVPVHFDAVEVTGTAVRATASGPRVEQPSTLVKAATHHGLHLTRHDDTLRVKVVLDV